MFLQSECCIIINVVFNAQKRKTPLACEKEIGKMSNHSHIFLWHLNTLVSISIGWYLIPRNMTVSSSEPTTNNASWRPAIHTNIYRKHQLNFTLSTTYLLQLKVRKKAKYWINKAYRTHNNTSWRQTYHLNQPLILIIEYLILLKYRNEGRALNYNLMATWIVH